MGQRAARIVTGAELKATAKRIKSKARGFGKASSEKYAREAQKRLDAFAKKTGV